MDDDYVAQVLAKEARETSQKYSAEGLSAYMPRKPAGNAPKPNTRFLRHLIKETDNHNTALNRKEEREARDRMRLLKNKTNGDSTSTSQTFRTQNRQSSIRDTDRHRKDDRDDRHRSHRRRHRSRSTSTDRDRSRRQPRRDDDERVRDEHRDGDRTDRRRERHRHESSRAERHGRKRSYSRSRSRSPRRDRSSERHRSERRSRRSKSPSGTHSSRSHRTHKDRRSERDEAPLRQSRSSRDTTRHSEHKPSSTIPPLRHRSDDESDPLEDLFGPLPPRKDSEPIRSRGRGAYKPSASAIDAHFAADYDPLLDVQPADDAHSEDKQSSRRPVAGLMTKEDDWDMALEALRDRAKWRQKGEDRLRAAGMNDATIDRWKSNAAFAGVDGERNPDEVKWSKKGEGREWDRGKVMNDDGHIDVKAAWK
ncbi:hypothetical protein N7448_010632 [Penicillium atrosanguineum]|uniref:Pre-mRNA-splicing factor 38B n=1 Tax=Penicillium atrosanguineum TaxID=1132637 RepID=A0A9W9PP46_9EURO|nr:hypothetical protein N7526_010561 [Penicillium atrosanguineum]KAJ5119963.1 hypothetical protein N7448_010632 [Penicillium atrosanguineum]KAJ5299722.1 hypothetical protein N7476_011279 [Penicillium atrosanguineum]